MENMAGNKVDDSNSVELTPRENLIKTAVTFLSNSKVQSSSMEHRINFLKKKGMTDEEIKLAVRRSNSATLRPHDGTPINTDDIANSSMPFWYRMQTFSSTAVVIGTAVYLLYKFYHNVVAPYFFKRHRLDDPMIRLEKVINSLEGTVKSLENVISNVQDKLTTCCEKVDELQSESKSFRAMDQKVQSLKDDITSLRGLLLNRKQFPAPPQINPIIPSWQLSSPSNTVKDDKRDDDSPNDEKSETEINARESSGNQLAKTSTVDGSSSSDNGSFICVDNQASTES